MSDGKEYKLLEECLELLYDYPLLFVKVSCPLIELKRREMARGDRDIGSAEGNYNLLYPEENNHNYDILVDTYENSTQECADKIIELIDNPKNFKAFKTLKYRMDLIQRAT